MQQGPFVDRSAKSSPMTMSSPLNGAAGLIGNSGRNTADACDTNASEMSVATTARFIFIEVRPPFPSQFPLRLDFRRESLFPLPFQHAPTLL